MEYQKTVSRKLKKEPKARISGKAVLLLIVFYGAPLLLINTLGLLVLKYQWRLFFRIVLLLYLTNVLIYPTLLLGSIGWNLVRQKRRSKKVENRERLKIRAKLGCALACYAVGVYATFVEPRALQVERIELVSPKVDREVTILHISDIQTGSVGRYEKKVFQTINRLQPDLIVHTGDLLQPYWYKDRRQEQDKLAALFRSLHPAYGTFNVLGDVDRRLSPAQFDELAGVTTLVNRSIPLQGKGVKFQLLGLSLHSSRRGDPALIKEWLQTTNAQEFTILFGHAPDYVLTLPDEAIDLCLAGHTHGGQVRIPFFGPFVTFSRVPKDWARGFRNIGKTFLNVSAGIGAEHAGQLPPIRINCPPTMTLFTITPQRK